MQKRKLLIVDDDPRFLELLSRYLVEQDFEVSAADSGRVMDEQRLRSLFDLLILDLNLPCEDGLAICRRLRASADPVPIIMLTDRAAEFDRIAGLETGADDYLSKTAPVRELVARIKAVLRRCSVEVSGNQSVPFRLTFGRFVLDGANRKLRTDGQVVNLTSEEYNLLLVMAKQAGRPLTRNELAEALKGHALFPDQRGIDMLISRLRKQIEVNPKCPDYIQTVRGLGYVFTPHGPYIEET